MAISGPMTSKQQHVKHINAEFKLSPLYPVLLARGWSDDLLVDAGNVANETWHAQGLPGRPTTELVLETLIETNADRLLSASV